MESWKKLTASWQLWTGSFSRTFALRGGGGIGFWTCQTPIPLSPMVSHPQSAKPIPLYPPMVGNGLNMEKSANSRIVGFHWFSIVFLYKPMEIVRFHWFSIGNLWKSLVFTGFLQDTYGNRWFPLVFYRKSMKTVVFPKFALRKQ